MQANQRHRRSSRTTAWGDIEQLAARMPLAEGYRFEPLKRAQVGTLIGFIETWFPDISVGGASCYLRDRFYAEKVFFEGGPERDVLVVLLKHGDELAGVFSCKRDLETLSVHARIGVAAPQHRGARLAQAGMTFTEEIGRRMGMGFIYGMATLKTPHVQRAFERAGWQLIGITPGYDREMVAPGVVKRVYEAVYTKVLVADDDLLRPQRQNLTPRTQAFFDWVFDAHRLDHSPARELQDARCS
jgi:hypothetical protein